MEKEYTEIKFPLGSSVKEAVQELIKYRNAGKFVYGKFNGVLLYSDTVTADDAYKKITGKTEEEFLKHINEWKRGAGQW